MRVLALVHEDDAGPGVFLDAARARRTEVVPWRIAAGERCPGDPESYDALLVLGGSMHADERARHPWLADEDALLAAALDRRQSVLGVCLGAQTLARAGAGSTGRLAEPEIGWYEVRLSLAGRLDPLLGPLGSAFHALQWHSCDFALPATGVALASSERCLQAFRFGETAWGIQFHAEVTLADFEAWLDQHLADPGSGDGPDDPERLRLRTRELIDGWNALGRALFGRFLDQAALARATR
ncbi:MAG TPA: type 1 glutamine amidotransferase [Solirubrobacteraceae bacterium]|nr:type 1 glutamine amidotransferase [Solirubrobacteraceae bacterium]